jgi:hypothetical protein
MSLDVPEDGISGCSLSQHEPPRLCNCARRDYLNELAARTRARDALYREQVSHRLLRDADYASLGVSLAIECIDIALFINAAAETGAYFPGEAEAIAKHQLKRKPSQLNARNARCRSSAKHLANSSPAGLCPPFPLPIGMGSAQHLASGSSTGLFPPYPHPTGIAPIDFDINDVFQSDASTGGEHPLKTCILEVAQDIQASDHSNDSGAVMDGQVVTPLPIDQSQLQIVSPWPISQSHLLPSPLLTTSQDAFAAEANAAGRPKASQSG